MAPPPPLDLSKPKWDQKNYVGRVMHFAKLTNPLNLLASDEALADAKKTVATYQKTKVMPPGHTIDMMWNKKYLADSAHHPDTGEKQLLIGRMAAQVPCNTFMNAAMTTFYKTTAQTVFWQWLNQTLNAVVNYTNRSGDAAISKQQIFKSYVAAVTGAVGTALFLKSKANKMKNPVFKQLVPFAAVCAANCINIPMMRSGELINGTPVTSATGERIGLSKTAARWGIFLTIVSRILMAVPPLVLPPVLTNYGLNAGWFCRYPHLVNPFNWVLTAICVAVGTPLGLAAFKQIGEMPASSLEEKLANIAKMKKIDTVYYNKGL